MRVELYNLAAGLVLSGMGVALLCGCAGESSVSGESCVLDDSEAIWQLSPTGQAVALVDPVAYERLLELDARTIGRGLDCVVEEFFDRFESDAESIVLIYHFEDRVIILNRLLIESGLDPLGPDDLSLLAAVCCEYELSAQPPVEVSSDVLEIWNAIPNPKGNSFNRTFRSLESGVGRSAGFAPSWAPPHLRGYFVLGNRKSLVQGGFLHEFCHHWAAYLEGPPVLAEQIGNSGSHWGITSIGGVLGGWLPDTLESLGDHVYRAWIAPWGWAKNPIPYAPLELYLMGLAGAEEVPPIEIAKGVELIELTETGGSFSATSFETVRIEDIIEANGPRLPGPDESEKHFKLALIILTDHELSDGEWDFYNRSIDFLAAAESGDVLDSFPEETYPEYYHLLSVWQNLFGDLGLVDRDPEESILNFYMATGGRGTIEFVQIQSGDTMPISRFAATGWGALGSGSGR